jgi:hypothetical protein
MGNRTKGCLVNFRNYDNYSAILHANVIKRRCEVKVGVVPRAETSRTASGIIQGLFALGRELSNYRGPATLNREVESCIASYRDEIISKLSQAFPKLVGMSCF